MLKIDNLHAFYGKSHVLHGVHFEVHAGEITALLGRNGSGRSTTAKAIMGLVDCHGSVLWKGQEITGKRTYEIAHLGIGYVPESRDIFPTLTVEQNLRVFARLYDVPRSRRSERVRDGGGHTYRQQDLLWIAGRRYRGAAPTHQLR